LHGLSHLGIQNDVGDDASFDDDSFIVEIGVEMLLHTSGMLLSSQGVSLSSLDRSCHGSDSLHNVGVDRLIDLSNVSDELLDVIGIWVDLQQD
jgi:hypothetical protein